MSYANYYAGGGGGLSQHPGVLQRGPDYPYHNGVGGYQQQGKLPQGFGPVPNRGMTGGMVARDRAPLSSPQGYNPYGSGPMSRPTPPSYGPMPYEPPTKRLRRKKYNPVPGVGAIRRDLPEPIPYDLHTTGGFYGNPYLR